MREVERCFAWVPSMSDLPQVVSVMENGTYRLDGQELEPDQVTRIPSDEWLRQNETDFRGLLEACHTIIHRPGSRDRFDAQAVMRDIVDRRWRAKE